MPEGPSTASNASITATGPPHTHPSALIDVCTMTASPAAMSTRRSVAASESTVTGDAEWEMACDSVIGSLATGMKNARRCGGRPGPSPEKGPSYLSRCSMEPRSSCSSFCVAAIFALAKSWFTMPFTIEYYPPTLETG